MGEKGSHRGKISTAAERQRRLAALAARQYGHVTRRQLLDLGLGARAIGYRVAAGTLIRVHAGVYAVGHPRPEPPARAAAAVLACGEGALLSHGSAATLWGIWTRWSLPLEVTVPGDRRRPEITIHRCRDLLSADRQTHLGISVTSPARTLLDMTPRLSDRRITRALSDLRRSAYLRPEHVIELVARNPRHRGARRLGALVREAPANPTRSSLEDDFLAFTAAHGLPTPQINARVNGYEVDALFAEHSVIVELDGWEFHRDRHNFAADRERDAVHLAAGLVTVRITHERLHAAPEREARQLRAILARRSG